MTTSTRTRTTNGRAPDDARLTQSHADTLIKDSAIDVKVAEKRGYWSAICDDDLKQIGFHGQQRRAPALVIPVWNTAGKVETYQIRPDNPRIDDRGQPRKYETRQGDHMVIDVHPFIRADLRYQDAPLYITEGIKKADAAVSRDLCCIALMGVTCWRGRNPLGGTAALADWNDIVLSDREVYIVYDSDAATKPGVMRAEVTLGRWLETRGAKVHVVRLPPGLGGKKVGLDDWLAAGHDADRLPGLAISLDDVAKQLKAKAAAVTSGEYIEALSALGYTFRMNDLDNSIEVGDEELDDPLMALIRAQLRDAGLMNVTHAQDAYIGHARENRYHPIRDYLNGLAWDGKPHIAALASYFTDAHTPVTAPWGGTCTVFHLWFRRWLVGAVAKVFDAKQNPMLVLDGEQDLGKSEFVKWLCSGLGQRYFIEHKIDPDDKDSLVNLLNFFVWEVGELGSTTHRANVEALKAFITTREVRVRPAYARRALRKPAVASLIGTVNPDAGFLNDPTGSRRYIVVTLLNINWKYTDCDIDQVWAEAVALYKSGESFRLTDGERELQREINEKHETPDPVRELLLKYYQIEPGGDDFVTAADILETLQNHGLRGGTSRAHEMAIASALRKLGVNRSRNWSEPGYPTVYYGVKRVYNDDDDLP